MLTHSTTLAAYRSLLKNRVDEALVILPSNAAVLVNDVLFCCPIRHGQADVTELESFDSESFDAGGTVIGKTPSRVSITLFSSHKLMLWP
ncbi:hypothetical protein SAMN05421724_0460 [Pseudomonas syringae]|uniref:hypothetical protein n=1 Tax=Pseudomonas syringae TaxID=317 RepID=UPI00020943A1|nr:hypothetical protein [Pseudomonas syringae]SDS01196.1 hypothetical protein SAMN05421724_0460 [Pseudomonas syringae]